MNLPPLAFDERDAMAASQAWGCNCGPGALAACCGGSLVQAREWMLATGFEKKGYTSPTMMQHALKAARRYVARDVRPARNCILPDSFPRHGLVRIQWGGPWTNPGSNPRWAYGYTHWVHTRYYQGAWWVFDINGGFRPYADWAQLIPPAITATIKRADGSYWPTHLWEIEQYAD